MLKCFELVRLLVRGVKARENHPEDEERETAITERAPARSFQKVDLRGGELEVLKKNEQGMSDGVQQRTSQRNNC